MILIHLNCVCSMSDKCNCTEECANLPGLAPSSSCLEQNILIALITLLVLMVLLSLLMFGCLCWRHGEYKDMKRHYKEIAPRERRLSDENERLSMYICALLCLFSRTCMFQPVFDLEKNICMHRQNAIEIGQLLRQSFAKHKNNDLWFIMKIFTYYHIHSPKRFPS